MGKPAKDRKTYQLGIRLTSEQFALLQRAAAQELIPEVVFARRALMVAVAKATETPIRGIVRTRSPRRPVAREETGT